MENVYEIIDLLKALKAYYHAAHLGAKDYALHLLFERLGDPILDEVDALSELLLAINIKDANVLEIRGSLMKQLEALDGMAGINGASPSIILEQALKLEDAILSQIRVTLVAENMPIGLKTKLEDVSMCHLQKVYLLKQSMAGTI